MLALVLLILTLLVYNIIYFYLVLISLKGLLIISLLFIPEGGNWYLLSFRIAKTG